MATDGCGHRLEVPFGSIAGAVGIYERANDAAVAAARRASEEEWTSPGRFVVMGNTISELPRQQLAWGLFLDAVHHRGQLSIYGPSADTPRG